MVANLSGDFYPTGPDVVPQMIEILGQQVAAPVQFIKGLRTLYDAGVRVFVETGPKKALHGFAEEVLGDRGDVLSLFTNHPKFTDFVAFNQALCGLYAAGLGRGQDATSATVGSSMSDVPTTRSAEPAQTPAAALIPSTPTPDNADRKGEFGGAGPSSNHEPVTITGAALGLPGSERIFDDGNVARILQGDQFISSIPKQFRQSML